MKNRNLFSMNVCQNKGFSILELLIVAGLMGAMALVGSSIIKNMNQGQATTETKMEELEIRRVIITTLTDKAACNYTFNGYAIGASIPGVKNSAGTLVFQVGNTYGNDSLQITSMKTTDLAQTFSDGTRMVNLVVDFKKLKKIIKSNVRSVNIQMRVKSPSGVGIISDCFVDADAVVKTACESAGGTWTGISCSFDSLYVKKAGDIMVGNLTAPQFLGNVSGTIGTFSLQLTSASGSFSTQMDSPIGTFSNKVSSPLFCSGANCKSIPDLALSNRSCPGGQVQDGVNADGTPRCQIIQCAANYYFAGLDSSSNVICRPYPTNTCPTNQYVSSVNANGTVNCAVLPNNANSICPAGQVLQSINAGVPTCVNKGANNNCSSGNYVSGVNADGSLNCTNRALSCPAGQVMSGINSSGASICVSSGAGAGFRCSCHGVQTTSTINFNGQCCDAATTYDCVSTAKDGSCNSYAWVYHCYYNYSCTSL